MSNNKKISSSHKVNELSRLKKLNRLYEKKMEVILQLSDCVNKNYTSEAIVEILHYGLKSVLNIKNIAFIAKNEDWELLLNYGFRFNLDSISIENDLKQYSFSQTIQTTNKELNKYEYVIPVFHKEENLGFLLIQGIAQEFIDCSVGQKFGYIISIVNLTIIALENKKLFRKIKSDRKIQEEIELAAEVQQKLIPSEFPQNSFYEFYGKYIPFDTVGGDYYDLIKLDNDNIAFCICDVSGKGISAGMLMSNFQASLRTLLSRKLSLKDLVVALNAKFLRITKQDRYISMFIGVYNLKSRKLEFVNAGHNPPVLKNKDNLLLLESGTTILGILDELPFIESETIYIENDALLVMYTDGFSEIKNEKGIEFGVENIQKNILENNNKTLEFITNDLMIKLHYYRGTNKIFDDISLLCAKFPFGEI